MLPHARTKQSPLGSPAGFVNFATDKALIGNGRGFLPSSCHIADARYASLGSGCSTEKWLNPRRKFQSLSLNRWGFFVCLHAGCSAKSTQSTWQSADQVQHFPICCQHLAIDCWLAKQFATTRCTPLTFHKWTGCWAWWWHPSPWPNCKP